MFYGSGRGLVGIFAIGLFGLILIWKGITGNVMQYEMGGNIIPRWMYVFGGLVMLLFPIAFFLVRSEQGRAWMGL